MSILLYSIFCKVLILDKEKDKLFFTKTEYIMLYCMYIKGALCEDKCLTATVFNGFTSYTISCSE